jgi:phage/plasmid-like protein (TIGR03299 family)
MSHEIYENDQMFSVREVPWHGLGKVIQDAPNSAEALRIAELDWEVTQENAYRADGSKVPNMQFNVNGKTNEVIGLVTDRYRIVQNKDAFAFTDDLIGGDVRYETAGSLRNGRTVWMLARMPEAKVAGDDVEQYMCFTNSHDGTGAVRVCLTPVRVVCNNTLNFALSSAQRSWSCKHTGDIQYKLTEARECLMLAERYILSLDEYANEMTNVKVDDALLKKLLTKCFPKHDLMTEREKKTMDEKKEQYMVCYWMPDIAKFRGTAWGALNAMSDFVGHAAPARLTKNYYENRWANIINGSNLMDRMSKAIKELA